MGFRVIFLFWGYLWGILCQFSWGLNWIIFLALTEENYSGETGEDEQRTEENHDNLDTLQGNLVHSYGGFSDGIAKKLKNMKKE